MSDPARWTNVAKIIASVRRRWTDGTLLRAYALREPFPVIEIALRGPSAADLGEHFDAARAWTDAVHSGSRNNRAYTVVRGRIGGRLAGQTEVPVRVLVSEFTQAWTLLGSAAAADDFRDLLALSAGVPGVREWALAHPVQASALAPQWPTLLAAYDWLKAHRGSGMYLRQVNAPGVDTKFIERNRGVLAAMLDAPVRGFERMLGFAEKPATVRMRFDSELFGFPSGISEATFRSAELRGLRVQPRQSLIIENEVTYLSVPVPEGGVVLWGKGYDADQSASLDWLVDTPVRYWGDIDTHGFAILNRVRTYLPQARSVLMDQQTLLAHEARWGQEPSPTSALLSNLDANETALYADLVSDRYGSALRLEQERIDWDWVVEQLFDQVPYTYVTDI